MSQGGEGWACLWLICVGLLFSAVSTEMDMVYPRVFLSVQVGLMKTKVEVVLDCTFSSGTCPP